MMKKWILVELFLIEAITYTVGIIQEVQENSEVIIECPLSGNIEYPTWTGPDGLASPLTQNQTINEQGISWVNNTNLKIARAMLKHDGNYTYEDANNNTATVELDVQSITHTVGIVQEIGENSEVVIECPLSGNIEYPTWTGPDGLASPLTQNQTINEQGISWVNNTNLKIARAMLKHDGNYTCKDANNNTATVELDVQYFSASADISTSSPENTQVSFNCTVHSNPRSTIEPSTFTRAAPDQMQPAKTTFHPCGPDPIYDNRTMCRMTDIGYALKQDNEREVKCKFIYKNVTFLTLTKSIKFLFPPTNVNITGNRPITDPNDSTLKLTCSTDSSNPVSTLVWRKGTKMAAADNAVIISNHPNTEMDDEYKGKNITQDNYIQVDENANGQKVFCCARHGTQDYCDSISLKYDVPSAASAVTKCLTLLVVCTAFIARCTA